MIVKYRTPDYNLTRQSDSRSADLKTFFPL